MVLVRGEVDLPEALGRGLGEHGGHRVPELGRGHGLRHGLAVQGGRGGQPEELEGLPVGQPDLPLRVGHEDAVVDGEQDGLGLALLRHDLVHLHLRVLAQFVRHAIEGVAQLQELVARLDVDPPREIAMSHEVGRAA